MKKNKMKAQATLEYAMVIICLVSALIAMQIYIKRSMQGRFRDIADELGSEQYSAKTATSSITQNFSTDRPTKITGDPVIVDVPDPITGEMGPKEFMIISRDEKQTLTQDPTNYEKTGKFSEEQLYD